MSTIAPDQIIDLIVAVRTRHPGIELRLCDSDAKDLRARLIDGDLELVVYALPGEEPDERTHVMPLFRERMVIAVGLGHRLANQSTVRVKDISGENYIHRNNCEFAGYADAILAEQGVTCNPAYLERSRRLDLGNGRSRARLWLPAGEFGEASRCRRPADHRARILAPGQSRQHSRAPLFAGGRCHRARSHAEKVVRRTGDGDAHCRLITASLPRRSFGLYIRAGLDCQYGNTIIHNDLMEAGKPTPSFPPLLAP